MKFRSPAATQEGSVLLEALIAITIFSAGILAMIWLQAAAARQVADSKYRLEASFIANQSLGEIWARRQERQQFAVKDQTISSLPGGKRTVVINGSEVTVTISWKPAGESKTRSYQAVALING